MITIIHYLLQLIVCLLIGLLFISAIYYTYFRFKIRKEKCENIVHLLSIFYTSSYRFRTKRKGLNKEESPYINNINIIYKLMDYLILLLFLVLLIYFMIGGFDKGN